MSNQKLQIQNQMLWLTNNNNWHNCIERLLFHRPIWKILKQTQTHTVFSFLFKLSRFYNMLHLNIFITLIRYISTPSYTCSLRDTFSASLVSSTSTTASCYCHSCSMSKHKVMATLSLISSSSECNSTYIVLHLQFNITLIQSKFRVYHIF